MKAVVDANILFAALIREGATRRIWFQGDLELIAPQFIENEFRLHLAEIQGKFAGRPAEFQEVFLLLFKQLRLVPDGELVPFMPAAATLITDERDWPYLACALKEDALIWSQDRHFRDQTRVKVRTTAELMAQIGGLGK